MSPSSAATGLAIGTSSPFSETRIFSAFSRPPPQRGVSFEVTNSGSQPLAINNVTLLLASNAQLGVTSGITNVISFMCAETKAPRARPLPCGPHAALPPHAEQDRESRAGHAPRPPGTSIPPPRPT